MPEDRFAVQVFGGIPVVTTPEEVDISNAERLRTALLEASGHGRGTLVVDMSATQFCDSSGIHVLLRAHKRAQAEFGELLLVLRATTVLRVFAITGIDRVIPNFSSLEDALAQAHAAGSTRDSPALPGSESSPSLPSPQPPGLPVQDVGHGRAADLTASLSD
jgi:anti-sigma B factor antagonist